ncbi:MAG: glycosyltransferase family 39 protein [Candidatus Margulisbacteria bacterium]|nr:glycosyltransferase family 39 protein [Candidatus Margulisiibacteriota bacterium]
MTKSLYFKGLAILIAVVLLIGGLIFVNRILRGDAFSKEEAQHALYGVWLVRDIQALDFGAFFYDTQRQMNWPFLHSWLLSLFFLIFGVSCTTARVLSLLFFLLSIVLIYLISLRFSNRLGQRIGFVAVLLALTSPLMVRYASENMLEGLGAFLFLAAVNTYLVCEENKITVEYIFLAVLIGLSIYTNYLYAYLMIPAFLVMTLVKLGPLFYEGMQLQKKGEKKALDFIFWAYRKLIVLFVILVLAGLWFSVSLSRKLLLFLAALFKYSGGERVEGFWAILTYYPRIIIQNLSFSPWLGLFLLLSLLVPFIAVRYRIVNRLYFFVWTVLLLLTFTIPSKSPQMIYIIVPFIFMIFSAALFYVLEKVEQKDFKLVLAVLLILLLPATLSIPQAWGLFFPNHPSQNMVQVMEYFGATVPADAKIYIPINIKHLNPETIEFHFRSSKAVVSCDFPSQAAGVNIKAQGANEYFMTVDISEGSPYTENALDDSLYRWNAWLAENEASGKIKLVSSRRFDASGVTAKVYTKI